MPPRHKHQREHATPRANPAKAAPGHVRNDHAAPLDASAEGNAGRRLPEGQSARPRLSPGTSRSSAAAGCPASAPPVAARSGACPWTSLRRGETDRWWRHIGNFCAPRSMVMKDPAPAPIRRSIVQGLTFVVTAGQPARWAAHISSAGHWRAHSALASA